MPETAPGFPKLEKQTRVWQCKKGVVSCSRTKPCQSCQNRRNRTSGQRKQRLVRKTIERQTGTQAGRYASQTGNEENWRMSIRVEVKSGKQVAAIDRLYRNAREQSDASCAVGDPRPFGFAAVPEGLPAGKFYWVIFSDDMPATADAFFEFRAGGETTPHEEIQ